MPYYSKTRWQERIEQAIKYKTTWESTFQCEKLYRYYRGFQYNQGIPTALYRPYTLNMIYSTIKIKLAGMLYQNPEFILTPTPGRSNWNQDFAVKTANLKQDTLNTVIKNRNINFVKNIKLPALDSFFRFGIAEMGYAADWTNPIKREGTTKSYDSIDIDYKDDEKLKVDIEIPENERVYVKHVPARRFLVSTSDSPFLSNCNWCGYWSYVYKSTLENDKNIELPKNYISSTYASEFSTILASFNDKENSPELIHAIANGQIYKVFNIWDNRKQEKLLILDECFETIWSGPFERLPFAEIKWDDEIEGWYPIPPVWQWLSSQDEINAAREQLRNYRRRYIRKFGYLKGAVDLTELDKFQSDIDGQTIELKRVDALVNIPNPEIGISIETGLNSSMADFNLISATSANARAQTSDITATESKIIDTRSQIRESAEQMDFSSFISNVGREILLQIQERFSEGMWIKYNADPGEQYLGEVKYFDPQFKYITSQDLNDGYDFDIDIAVTNAVPARMQEEEAKFMKFIAIMTQFPQLALSPKLIREAAYRVGYRNEAIIAEMQQAAISRMIAQASAQGQVTGQSAGNPSGANGIPTNGAAAAASMQTNSNPNPIDEIARQMQGQMGNA